MVPIDFSGQSVLVTGGSAGIGLGIARLFQEAGADVTITGTKEAAHYGADIESLDFLTLDDSKDDDVVAFRDAWGGKPLDVLVNSIGTVAYKRKEFEIETFRFVMDVNLTGVFHLCTVFKDKLKESAEAGRAGALINIASLASFNSTVNNPAYSASKGGLAILTKTLADNWGREGIRVNGIAPGFVASKLTAVSRDNPKIYEASIKATPLGRWGTPEDMGGVALFLASPLAAFVVGQTIPVDGGISLS